MARSRNIKPGFFTNEDLVELEFSTRLLFAGLWTVADKEGRLQDRPKKIKIDIFPADNIDVDPMLQELHNSGFIVRYVWEEKKYIQIKNWAKHQNPHHTEKPSEIPDPNGALTVKAPLEPKHSPKQDGGNLADSLLLIPDSGFLVTDPLINSVAKATGGKPPAPPNIPPAADPPFVNPLTVKKPKVTDPSEIIFGYGVPMLVNAGTADKQARSFLGGLRKNHGDAVLIDVLRQCVAAKPLQPLEWLAAALPPPSVGPKPNAQDALEASNAAAAQRFLMKDKATSG